jgi:hypothetical protein
MLEVVWLEDPYKWDYLREGIALTTQRHGGIKPGSAWKVIGYENVAKKGRGICAYTRRFWWLKDYDRGCPHEHRNYAKGKLEPSEAVAPKDIKIPEAAKVLHAYKIEKAVFECNSQKCRNQEFNRAEREKRPFIVVQKGREYASFRYDMWPVGYDLNREAANTLEQMVIGFLNNIPLDLRDHVIKGARKKWITYYLNKTAGTTPQIRIFECRLLAKEMKDVIMNKDNWVQIR